MTFFEYISKNYMQVLTLLIEHLKLTAISVGLAILIGVPLGILIAYSKNANKPILAAANIIQAIPSMALLGFMIPFLGIGKVPSIVAVVLYSLLPIIKNTYTGIESINPQTIEAAKGIGLTPMQILFKVKIPLALPVIMAGVRIASVTAVGLMTVAAYIGAGGLGYLVFSGIRTVNNNQILAGAIPACILALLVDFVLGAVEKLVTPISLQKGDNTEKKKKRSIQKIIILVATVLIAMAFIFTSFKGKVKEEKVLTVGAKDYTEQELLGNLVSDMIEGNTDIKVNRKFDLGGTQVIFTALQKGDIDMYVEYSGTAYTSILKHPPIGDLEEVNNVCQEEFMSKYNIETLKRMNFNNTYALAVTQETAKKYKLETVSDFAKVASKMKSGTTYEFLNRDDGLPGMEKVYGFKMGSSIAIDSAPRYTALVNKEVDVIDAFTTDGLLMKFKLKILEDDKHFFPPYNPFPIIRTDRLEEYPEIVPVLEKLGDALTEEVMMELNYKVDELHQAPSKVSKEFLKKQGFIK